MNKKIEPLNWKKNPVYIAATITIISFIVMIYYLFQNSNPNFSTGSIIVTSALLILTGVLYRNQCPHCKRVFTLRKISDEIIERKEVPRKYREKTIYYYSDGETVKDIKYGDEKTFIAIYETHRKGYVCKECGETHYRIEEIFVNKEDWEKIKTPNKITTNIKKPEDHYTNLNFDIKLFKPTYYKDKKGRRRTIPKSVKVKLWKKYFGEVYEGKCYVCGDKINITNFEAGHVIPVSEGGTDKIDNLRPLCSQCNRSMGNRNLYEFKRTYGL